MSNEHNSTGRVMEFPLTVREAYSKSAGAWDRVSFGGYEVRARVITSAPQMIAPRPLGRTAGSYAGECTFEIGADMAQRIMEGLRARTPTDDLAWGIKLDLASTIPAVVQRGLDMERRWAKRLRRREARSGTVGRRGSRGFHEARET